MSSDWMKFLEAWLRGFNTAVELRVDATDGEAVLEAAYESFQNSGTRRAERMLGLYADDYGDVAEVAAIEEPV